MVENWSFSMNGKGCEYLTCLHQDCIYSRFEFKRRNCFYLYVKIISEEPQCLSKGGGSDPKYGYSNPYFEFQKHV